MTNAQRRAFASLALPKGRRKERAFLAEGSKCVRDTIAHFSLRHLVATEAWLADNPDISFDPKKLLVANRGEIAEFSSMTRVPDVVAVYDLPEEPVFDPSLAESQLVLALDRVQDPGNLGTIMRTADWMGISTVWASADTVDCFNPKAVQATMGAISRVNVIYGSLPEMLTALSAAVPVYGTFLDGENIYASPLTANGVIVMGNEGRGISAEVSELISRRLLIPSYPPDRPTSESLNVGSATAIVLSQFRSRHHNSTQQQQQP